MNDYEEVFRAAARAGLTVMRTKKHVRLVSPDKEKGVVISSSTPSDHRSYENLLSTLRRVAGFDFRALRRSQGKR